MAKHDNKRGPGIAAVAAQQSERTDAGIAAVLDRNEGVGSAGNGSIDDAAVAAERAEYERLAKEASDEAARLRDETAKLQAEVAKLTELHRKFKGLYDDVRIRMSGLAALDQQLKAASGILDKTLSRYTRTATTEGAAHEGENRTGSGG